jgi:cytochrome c556
MAVRVDELTSDVTVEPEAAAPSGPAGGSPARSRWQQADEFRALRERLARDAERTRAEAYSD